LTEDPVRRNEIETSLKSVVESSEKWLGRLRRRQREVRLISSFLTAVLVFFATLIVDTIVILISAHVIAPSMSPASISSNFTNFFQKNPDVVFEIAAPAVLTTPIAFVITYLLMRWKHEARMKELAGLIAQMKRKMQKNNQGQLSNTAVDREAGPVEDAFSLTNRIFTLLPDLARRRNQDSLLFGFVAFVLALLGGNFAVAILVGVIVWIYFRYETKKTYEEQIAKFEEQKRFFEQRKKDFIDTLL
jgi:hypothetical protein